MWWPGKPLRTGDTWDCIDGWEALKYTMGGTSIKALRLERAWDTRGTIKKSDMFEERWSKDRLVSNNFEEVADVR